MHWRSHPVALLIVCIESFERPQEMVRDIEPICGGCELQGREDARSEPHGGVGHGVTSFTTGRMT
jgi:hypothetical protein